MVDDGSQAAETAAAALPDTGDCEEEEFFPEPTDPPKAAPTEDEQLTEAVIESLLEELGRLKEVGNGHFKKGENAEAISAYADAVEHANEVATSEQARDAVKPLLISLHNNSAAAQLKLEEWTPAIASASAAIDLDASNSKALFRRGVARSKLGMLSSAKDDLTAACRADPKDAKARSELAQVQEAIKAQRAGEKASFAEKFGAATEKAVAKEEARLAAIKREEERVKALADEALRAEWKTECARLRMEQREQRETARLARLRKFLGAEAGDAMDADAGGTGEGGRGGAPAGHDLSRWARADLTERLQAVAVDLEGVRVCVAENGVRSVDGWASATPTAAGCLALFELAFDLDWRVVGAGVVGSVVGRSVGNGTLKYRGVAPTADGGGSITTEAVEENIMSPSESQPNPDTPPHVAAERRAQVASAVGALREAVLDALGVFAVELAAQPVDGNGGGAAVGGGAGMGADVTDPSVNGEEEEAPPITFEAYKKEREKAEKEAKEAKEAKEKKAREAAEEDRRRARKAERIKVDDEDLAGMKGYKVGRRRRAKPRADAAMRTHTRARSRTQPCAAQ